MTQLVNLTPGEPLGYVSYFRATFGATWDATAGMFAGGMGDVYDALTTSNNITPVNTNPAVPGERVAVVDLRTYPRGETMTAATLAAWLDDLDWRVELRSLERISQAQATGTRGEQERTAEKTRETAANPGPLDQLVHGLSALRVVVILVALVILVWLALKAWDVVTV